MRKTILVLGLAVLAVGLLAVASQYKAEQVIFDDAEDLQAKFDAGDLGGGGGGGGAIYSAEAGTPLALTLSSSFQDIRMNWSDGYDPAGLFTPGNFNVCYTGGTTIKAIVAIAFSADVDAIVTGVEYAIGTGNTGAETQTGEIWLRDHHTASSIGMGVVQIGVELQDNECVVLMARHSSSTDDLIMRAGTLSIWEAGGSGNVHNDDVTVSGTVTADGFSSTNNAAGNVWTLLANGEGGSDHTCASKGVAGTLGMLDTDDTDGVENWVFCDGTETFAPVGNLQQATMALELSGGVVDAYYCPMTETTATSRNQNPNAAAGSCMVPEGYEIRFHELHSIVHKTLSDDLEECQLSIGYRNTTPSTTTIEATVNDTGGASDAILDIQGTACGGGVVRGTTNQVLLDRTETVTGWWSVHAEQISGCTCTALDGANVNVTFEMTKIDP